jgi:hypothetical protein
MNGRYCTKGVAEDPTSLQQEPKIREKRRVKSVPNPSFQAAFPSFIFARPVEEDAFPFLRSTKTSP